LIAYIVPCIYVPFVTFYIIHVVYMCNRCSELADVGATGPEIEESKDCARYTTLQKCAFHSKFGTFDTTFFFHAHTLIRITLYSVFFPRPR